MTVLAARATLPGADVVTTGAQVVTGSKANEGRRMQGPMRRGGPAREPDGGTSDRRQEHANDAAARIGSNIATM